MQLWGGDHGLQQEQVEPDCVPFAPTLDQDGRCDLPSGHL